jgi:hypothetical protein
MAADLIKMLNDPGNLDQFKPAEKPNSAKLLELLPPQKHRDSPIAARANAFIKALRFDVARPHHPLDIYRALAKSLPGDGGHQSRRHPATTMRGLDIQIGYPARRRTALYIERERCDDVANECVISRRHEYIEEPLRKCESNKASRRDPGRAQTFVGTYRRCHFDDSGGVARHGRPNAHLREHRAGIQKPF